MNILTKGMHRGIRFFAIGLLLAMLLSLCVVLPASATTPEEDAELLEYEQEAIGVFWVMFAFWGYLLPIVPLVLGLVFPKSRSRKNPRYWYLLAILAGVWYLLAIVLTVLLL